jgi:hypothetical protein
MENESQFDLETAIQQWRANLLQSPALVRADVEELELHLRESIRVQQTKGLSLSQAFLIAQERLGSTRKLVCEYGKAHPERVWMDRGLWLATGLLLMQWIAIARNLAGMLTFNLTVMHLPNAYWTGFAETIASWIVQVLAMVFLWRLVTRYQQWVAPFIHLCLRRPLLPVLGLCLVEFNWLSMLKWIRDISRPQPAPNLASMADVLNAWGQWAWYGEILIYLGAFLYLIRCHQGLRKDSPTNKDGASGPAEFQNGPALVGQGLSAHESFMMASYRQQPGANSYLVTSAGDAETWVSRCIWMLLSVLMVNPLLDLCALVSRLVFWSVTRLPLPDLISVISAAAVEFVAMAAMLVFLWRFLTHHLDFSHPLGRFIGRWPVASLLGFWCLQYGFFYSTGPAVHKAMNNLVESARTLHHENYLAFIRWHELGLVLYYGVIPCILIFWLARRLMDRRSALPA